MKPEVGRFLGVSEGFKSPQDFLRNQLVPPIKRFLNDERGEANPFIGIGISGLLVAGMGGFAIYQGLQNATELSQLTRTIQIVAGAAGVVVGGVGAEICLLPDSPVTEWIMTRILHL